MDATSGRSGEDSVRDNETTGARSAQLAARLAALETSVERLGAELRTSRLSLVDALGRERLVAQVVDDVAELRLDLPTGAHSRRSGVLVFAAPGGRSLPAGFGVQLWLQGDLFKILFEEYEGAGGAECLGVGV
ncbi:MAG: hypothetical protein ACRDVP_04475 [Acidimicrobiales bacterium]